MENKIYPLVFLRQPFSLIVYIIAVISILAIILLLGLPFTTLEVDFYAMFGLCIVALIASYGVILLMSISYALFSLSGLENKIDVFVYKPDVVGKVRNYCIRLGTVSFAVYLTLQIGTLSSPYGYNEVLTTYMLILSIIPLAFYTMALIFSKRVIDKSKQREIKKT